MKRCFISVYSAESGIPGISLTNDLIKPHPLFVAMPSSFIHYKFSYIAINKGYTALKLSTIGRVSSRIFCLGGGEIV